MKYHFILFLMTTFSISLFAQDITGNWTGMLTGSKGSIEINFSIFKKQNTFESSIDIPFNGLFDVKAEETTVKDSVIVMTFPKLNLVYKGKVKNKSEINGHLFKGGNPIVLDLKLGEKVKLQRPQEPLPPFDYYTENVAFKSSEGLQIKGTLSLPNKKGKFPVVIIISGSGPHDRVGNMYGHKPYLVIADHLTKNGIGVLRYDERGIGESEGNFEAAKISEFSEDVSSAISYLKTRKNINKKKIGLIGHSLGGIVGSKVASERTDVSFLVLMAAPGLDGDEMMLLQKAALERQIGANEAQIEFGQKMMKGTYAIITETSLEKQALKDSLNSFYIKNYGPLIPENQREAIVNQLGSSEIVSLIRSKPSEFIEKVNCPVLAINGSKDLQVTPKENLEAIKTSLKKSGNTDFEILEFDNLNHLFQESETGSLNEYAQLEQTISPEVLKKMTSWILEQVD
ncbi:alpha/beta hydrolase family protein [Psychroflexus tropicus]|uniref:alpha/beta hydrolase family protein n=1 Tax=Psychroflexus tropicus TaxID=197345 RepID=UPI0003A6AEF1|nr:alpha/beta fold hydrolase [Psychroflexus tropicus]